MVYSIVREYDKDSLEWVEYDSYKNKSHNIFLPEDYTDPYYVLEDCSENALFALYFSSENEEIKEMFFNKVIGFYA